MVRHCQAAARNQVQLHSLIRFWSWFVCSAWKIKHSSWKSPWLTLTQNLGLLKKCIGVTAAVPFWYGSSTPPNRFGHIC